MAHNETALVESKDFNVPPHRYGNDVESVLISEENLQARIQELADKVSKDYADTEEDLLLICVLKGAVYFLTDFARALSIPSQIEFMAVSSYGNSTSSSGVVRILKQPGQGQAGVDDVFHDEHIAVFNLAVQVLQNAHDTRR